MMGEVASYDEETKAGTIKVSRELFKFTLDQWLPDVSPEVGDEVKFDVRVNNAVNINLLGVVLNSKADAVKSKYIAGALSFFLGWAGLSRIYLGFYQMAAIQIAVTAGLVSGGLMGFAMLWGFIETILLLGGHIDRDAKGRPLK
jgi:TM2 domain-containing membrane protein YozV